MVRDIVHPWQRDVKSTPMPAWGLQVWGSGPASEHVALCLSDSRGQKTKRALLAQRMSR